MSSTSPPETIPPSSLEREAWLRGQREALERAVFGAPLVESLGVLVDTATASLGPGTRAAFYLSRTPGEPLRHVVGMTPEYADLVDCIPVATSSFGCALAIHGGIPVLTKDVMDDERWDTYRWLAERFGYRGCWSFPIQTHVGRPIGTLAMYWPDPKEATPRDLELASYLTHTAAIIISQHEQSEARRRAERRSQLLSEAAAVLLSASDPDAMLGGVFSKIAPHFGLDAYVNFMVEEGGETLRLATSAGFSDDFVSEFSRLPLGGALCGWVAKSRTQAVATHVQGSDDMRVVALKPEGIRAVACNPLMSGEQLLGTISFASRTHDEFPDAELEFLQTICQYVASAYERLRLLTVLRHADQKKDEFLATLAHELRNPLAPIRNGLQIMKLAGEDPRAVELSRTIMERQVEQLTRLIDDLLDVSRITSGKIVLKKAPVRIGDALRDALDASRPLIDAARHSLAVEIPEETLEVEGDLTRLSQVFANLLNNAAKYTEPGGRIRLALRREHDEAVVVVEDDGIGIPTHMLSHVCEMFTQVDRSLERAQGGLGIGLNLVKRLTEKHGGTLTVASEGHGKGSRFTVRLPLLGARGGDAAAPGAPQRDPVARRRILVVDDNVDGAQSLARLLALGGNETRAVYDGGEALELGGTFLPDVVLMDIGMPKLNGYETCKRLRTLPWGRDVVVVACTGWGQEEDRRRALEAGFDQHLTKPIDLAELQRRLAAPWRDGTGTVQDVGPPI